MIIFLAGPDSYRRSLKEREIIDAYRKKHGSISDDRFDFSQDPEIEDLEVFLVNNSMFETHKLAVIESISKVPPARLAKLLKSYLEDGSKTTILIVSDGTQPLRLSSLKRNPPCIRSFCY